MDKNEEPKRLLNQNNSLKARIDRSKTRLNFENSLKNLENSLKINTIPYLSYKDDRIKELTQSFIDYMKSEDYEKALNILKKIIFIDPASL